MHETLAPAVTAAPVIDFALTRTDGAPRSPALTYHGPLTGAVLAVLTEHVGRVRRHAPGTWRVAVETDGVDRERVEALMAAFRGEAETRRWAADVVAVPAAAFPGCTLVLVSLS